MRQIGAEDNKNNSVLDRIVATANRLNMLKGEEIGSIPLEMTYFYLFSLYRQYKLGNNMESRSTTGHLNTILRRLYAEEWDNPSDRLRVRHRVKLTNQLTVGRQWSLAVNRLSHRVLLLTSKKLSTLM